METNERGRVPIEAKRSKGNSVRVLKEANKFLILQCIMKLAPLSIEDIVQHTGLSRPTVFNGVKELMEEEIVVKDGFSESGIGRSAALLTLNGQAHFALGIDFEFPAIRMAIANMKGEMLANRCLTCKQDIDKDELLEMLYREIEQFVNESGVERSAIVGAGVGISGVIDLVKGMSLNIERIRGWVNVPLKDDLEQLLGIPVYLRNDVHLLGLVEKRLYQPDSLEDFIYVAVRAGIGSITYQHGKPMRGEKGNAGFIGHTTIDPRGPRCCCGGYGCLETYAGQLAIANHYMECSHQRLTFDEVVSRATEGEELAGCILSDAGFYFGVALANLVKTFEIPQVIVGGTSALENSPFIQAASEALHSYDTESLNIDARLEVGKLPESQYALGGCYLVFEHMLSKPHLALSISSVAEL